MHVDRAAGVPLHLASALRTKIVALRADGAAAGAQPTVQADATWHTPKVPPKDYCAELRHMPRP